MKQEDAVRIFMDKLKLAYITDQNQKGIRSSGESAASLHWFFKPTGAEMWGSHYFYQQEHGRKPGQMPPVEAIIEWIRAKHIQADISDESLAWAIAKKIAKSGTDIYQHKRPALDVSKPLEDLKKELIANLLGVAKTNIVTALKTEAAK